MLWIDADRLAGLTDTLDQPKLDNQRDVVLNERRQSYENRPYGLSELLLVDDRHGARSARRRAARRRGVLQEVLRPQQCDDGDRRGRQARRGAPTRREVLRLDPARARAGASSVQGAAAVDCA